MLGSNGWMRDDLVKLLDLIGSGKLKPVIDQVLPLEEVNEAFRLLEDREVFGKVVLKPSSEETSKRLSAEQVQAIFDRSPFISFLGLRVTGLDHDKGELAVRMLLRAGAGA